MNPDPTLLLALKAHKDAADELLRDLQSQLLARAPTGVYAELGGERIVITPNAPRLSASEAAQLLARVQAVAPEAADLFGDAKFNLEALATARGSTEPQVQAAVGVVDSFLAGKRATLRAAGRERLVQVSVLPTRVAAHRRAIEESLAQASQPGPAQPEPVSLFDGLE